MLYINNTTKTKKRHLGSQAWELEQFCVYSARNSLCSGVKRDLVMMCNLIWSPNKTPPNIIELFSCRWRHTHLRSSDIEMTSRWKIHLFGQHRHNAWDLLLCMEKFAVGDRFKLYCHLVVHSCHDVHELQVFPICGHHFAQWLDEPGAWLCISPWVVACRGMRTLYKVYQCN